MDDLEARIRILELASELTRPSGDYSPESVVKAATVLYTFTKASPEAATPSEIVDKPKRGKPAPKEADILS